MLSASLRVELQATHPSIKVSVVMPGVVATEFGLNALGGGPDSRKMPMAQPVDAVARVIVDVIEKPRAEVYSNPGFTAEVERYVRDPDAFEAEVGARFRR